MGKGGGGYHEDPQTSYSPDASNGQQEACKTCLTREGMGGPGIELEQAHTKRNSPRTGQGLGLGFEGLLDDFRGC